MLFHFVQHVSGPVFLLMYFCFVETNLPCLILFFFLSLCLISLPASPLFYAPDDLVSPPFPFELRVLLDLRSTFYL